MNSGANGDDEPLLGGEGVTPPSDNNGRWVAAWTCMACLFILGVFGAVAFGLVLGHSGDNHHPIGNDVASTEYVDMNVLGNASALKKDIRKLDSRLDDVEMRVDELDEATDDDDATHSDDDDDSSSDWTSDRRHWKNVQTRVSVLELENANDEDNRVDLGEYGNGNGRHNDDDDDSSSTSSSSSSSSTKNRRRKKKKRAKCPGKADQGCDFCHLIGNDPNQYRGLGSDDGLDGNRRSKNNRYIDSTSIRGLGAPVWRFDVAEAFPQLDPSDAVFSRIVGTLSTPQIDEDTVYFNIGSAWNEESFSFADPSSKLVALNRENGEIRWVRDYTRSSTRAKELVVQKFPDEYNLTEFEAWLTPGTGAWSQDPTLGGRTSLRQGSFAPITILGDYIFTGDSNTNTEFQFTDYLSNIVAQNETTLDILGLTNATDGAGRPYSSPIMGFNAGLDTNRYRHVLRDAIWVMDRRTGDVLAANRYSDSGEPLAEGVVQLNVALRMTTPFVDPKDCQMYLISGCSITTVSPFTYNTDDPGRAQVAILNGNMLTNKGGRLTKFVINGKGRAITLDETRRFYTVPSFLKAGDVNPYTGERFATNHEAERYNYHFDGVWAMRPMIDLDRRQMCFGTGNGLQMPPEDIALARDARIASSPRSHPEWSWPEWNEHLTSGSTVEEQDERSDDLRITNEDRHRALSTAFPRDSGGNVIQHRPQAAVDRYKKYLSNSISCIGLDHFEFRWTWRRTAMDTVARFISTFARSGGLANLGTSGYDDDFTGLPDLMRWMIAGNGGDMDFGIGPLHVRNDEGLDIYVAFGKDGTVQGLNPLTGDVLWYTKVCHHAWNGGMNYGATTDGKFLYPACMNMDSISPGQALSVGAHVIQTNPPTVNITRFQDFGQGVVLSYIQSGDRQGHSAWRSNNFHDNFGENVADPKCSNGFCSDNFEVPEGQGYLAKINARTGELVVIGAEHSLVEAHRVQFNNNRSNALSFANSWFAFDGIHESQFANVPTSSVNDVILTSGGRGGTFYAFSSDDFEVLWVYDARVDMDPFINQSFPPPFVEPLAVFSAVVPAGNDVFVGAGEVSVGGTFPGKFFYKFSV